MRRSQTLSHRRANVLSTGVNIDNIGSIAHNFEDEVAIVTGGSSDIGREIVLALAEAGATVLSADIRAFPPGSHNTTPTHEVADDLPSDVLFIDMDVSDPDDVCDVVEKAREFVGVDVMVNNAGIHIPQ